MKIAKTWKNYECLDVGEGYKIERFGPFILKRPEPSISDKFTITNPKLDGEFKNKKWIHNNIPNQWVLEYKNYQFALQPSEYKHLGIFPEQAVNWDFIEKINKRKDKPLRILNLFGYTGAATVVAASGNNEEIVHIDALKSAIARTQENLKLNGLEDQYVRTIVDDALKFIQREKRRGRSYHGIIMDPPSFGRGPNKEIWKIEEQLPILIDGVVDILDDDPEFIIINTYTKNLSHQEVLKLLKSKFNPGYGKFSSNKLGVPITHKPYPLTLGNTTRWCKYEDIL